MVDSLETRFSDLYQMQDFTDFTVNGQPAGLYKTAGTFSYARFYGAGHEVPAYEWTEVEKGAVRSSLLLLKGVLNFSRSDGCMIRLHCRCLSRSCRGRACSVRERIGWCSHFKILYFYVVVSMFRQFRSVFLPSLRLFLCIVLYCHNVLLPLSLLVEGKQSTEMGTNKWKVIGPHNAELSLATRSG